jgi:CDP-glycerol glycerophosphotransferase
MRQLFLAIVLFPLACVVPKCRRIWCFGSWFGERYADNSKYAFEAACEIGASQGIEPYWISRSPEIVASLRKQGKNAHISTSVRGLWIQLRAHVFVCTINCRDFCFGVVTPRSVFVQLWHGSPLKKIGFDAPAGVVARCVSRIRAFTTDRYSFVVSPAPIFDKPLMSAFGIDKKKVLRSGYPRNDGLFVSECRKREIRSLLSVPPTAQLVLYLPTHRSEGRDVDALLPLFKGFRYAAAALANQGIHVVAKPHFYDLRHFPVESSDGFAISHTLEGLDLYEVLGASDALVTDYSSVFFDYEILGRPVYFLTPDMDWYREKGRGLYFPLDLFVSRYSLTVEQLLPDLRRRRSHLNSGVVVNESRGPGISAALVNKLMQVVRNA